VRTLSMRLYLAVAALGAAGYFLVPNDTWAQTGWAVAMGYLAVAAVVVGVRRHRPAAASAWWCFAAGVFLNSTGQFVEAVIIRLLHDDSWPSGAIIFYYLMYPCLVTGLVILVWHRTARRDWAAMVDATTIATGVGLLSWVYVIGPAVGQPDVSLFTQLVGIAFPGSDVVLLAMMTRLLLGGGARSGSFRLLTASLMVFLGGDLAWAVINQLALEPGVTSTRILSTNFFGAYVLLGVAALHPSIRELGRHQAATRERRLSRPLLGSLTAASLIAPAVLGVEVAQGKIEVTDGFPIVVGSVALFLLVVSRMGQLLREVDAQAGQLRQLARVDELTGLPNRRAWASELPLAVEHARRDGAPLAVAMIDLDHFKRFNDEYGHPAGDRLLKGAAAAWADQLRAVDRLARYGGEEFIAMLPSADAEQAVEALQRLRRVTPAGQTFSAGIAIWDGIETSDEIVARADVALYAAKAGGRNRTVLATGAPVPDLAA
jgi:diguanylate cyclase (GGDEF)-like protein